jgi:hypothetical protein
MLHIYYSHPIHNNKNEQDNQVSTFTELKNKIENIPDEDIVCYVNGKDIILNDNENIIIEKFKKENADIIFAGEMIQPLPKYNDIYTKLYNANTIITHSQHKYLSSVGFIGYRKALYFVLMKITYANNFTEYFLKTENHGKTKMKIDTKTNIFLNMRIYFVTQCQAVAQPWTSRLWTTV